MQEVRNVLFGNHDPYADFANPLPFNNHGWASEHPAFEEFIVKVRPKLIIEVGTWFGGSARNMASLCLKHGIADFEIVCIDTFLGSMEMWTKLSYLMTMKNGRPTVYEQFMSNTIHAGMQPFITPFPCDAENAFLTLHQFGIVPDLVYIDAGHDYYSVKNDLVNWSSILRSGGVLLEDDAHHPPIIQATKEVFGESFINHGAKFSWTKP